MPANGPVNVTKQSIFAAIPILDIYSAYHIKKLRRYLLLVILIIATPQTIIELALFGSMLDIPEAYVAFMYTESNNFYQSQYVILWMIIGIVFSVTIIRHWSKEWNYKIDVS